MTDFPNINQQQAKVGNQCKSLLWPCAIVCYITNYTILICLSVTEIAPPLLFPAWVRIPVWACEKVASDLGLRGGFCRFARHELATICHICDEERNSKFQLPFN